MRVFFLLTAISLAFLTDERLKYAETINSEDLKAHLTVLASDDYEGRETGTKGQKKAATYIGKYFQEIGLKAPFSGETPYFQSIQLSSPQMLNSTLSCNGKFLHAFTGFYPFGTISEQINAQGKKVLSVSSGLNPMKASMEAIYVGYGTRDDFARVDLKGKMAVISLSDEHNAMLQIRTAMEHGAKFTALIHSDEQTFYARNTLAKATEQRTDLFLKDPRTEHTNIVFISPRHAHKLFDLKRKEWANRKTGLSASVSIYINSVSQTVYSENVVGIIEGSDKKEEVLAISAHYDHVGIVNGQIHNGADDDGSGTVAMLEIAQAFMEAKKAGKGPRRTIIFLAFTGEEKGLLGSQFYAENPIFKMENTVANLNIDMIGRVDAKHAKQPYYTYIIGSNMLSKEMHALHEQVAAKYSPEVELDYAFNSENDPNRFYYRSDHYNFAKNKIPVIFYFNGTHPDYHKPTDDVSKINFDKLSKVAKLIFHTAWELANVENRPKLD